MDCNWENTKWKGSKEETVYRQFSDNKSHLHDTGTQAQVEKDINVAAQTQVMVAPIGYFFEPNHKKFT